MSEHVSDSDKLRVISAQIRGGRGAEDWAIEFAKGQSLYAQLAEDVGFAYEQTAIDLNQLLLFVPPDQREDARRSNFEVLRRLYPQGPMTKIRARQEDREIWSLADLAAAENLQPPVSYLADMVSSGGVMVLAGRRGVGKTYLTLWLASRLAQGLDFGPFKTRPGNVLFVSQEMSDFAIRKRIRKLFPDPAVREAIGRRLRIVCRVPGIKLDTPEGASSLRALIEQEPTDIVILDTLRKLKGVYAENDNDDMGDLMDRLNDDVATPTRVAAILVHHMGKPDKDGIQKGARGGSAIEDAAEDVIYLSFDKADRKQRVAEIEKSRDGELEGSGFAFEIVSAGSEDPDAASTVEVVVRASVPEQSEADHELLKVREIVEASPGGELEQQEIARKMGWHPVTASRHLKRASGLGLMGFRGGNGLPKFWFATTPKVSHSGDRG